MACNAVGQSQRHNLSTDSLQARMPAGWKRNGAELAGPCPECGGKDRCFISQKTDLQFAVCRQCEKSWHVGAKFLDMQSENQAQPKVDDPFPCPQCARDVYPKPLMPVSGQRTTLKGRKRNRMPYWRLYCECGAPYSDLHQTLIRRQGYMEQALPYEMPSGETLYAYRSDGAEGKATWVDKGLAGDRCIQFPHAPPGWHVLIIVEGEKAAAAMADRVPDNFAVGCYAASTYANTVTLDPIVEAQPTQIFLSPDADVPGLKAVRQLWTRLLRTGLDSAIHVKMWPEGLSDGTDCADADADMLHAHLGTSYDPYSLFGNPNKKESRESAKRKELNKAGGIRVDSGPSAETFIFIAQSLGLLYRFDELRFKPQWRPTDDLVKAGLVATTEFQEWDDIQMQALFELIRSRYYTQDENGRIRWLDFGARLGQQALFGSMQAVRFNPFLEYLKQCQEKNGSPTLYACLQPWGIDPHDPYDNWVCESLWRGVVQRALRPGCQIRTFPLLVGDPGIGKSSYLREMLPAHLHTYYTDSLALSMRPQERTEATFRKLIVELGELRGISKTSAGEVKAWVTSISDSARPAYAKPGDWPRQWFLTATMNPTDTIPADPGIWQRFACLTMQAGPAVEPYLDEWRESFWAQAYALYLDDPEGVSVMPLELREDQQHRLSPYTDSVDELESAFNTLIQNAQEDATFKSMLIHGDLNAVSLARRGGLIDQEDKSLGRYYRSWGSLLVSKGATKLASRKKGTCYDFSRILKT